MNGLIEFISTPVALLLRGIHAMLSSFLAPGSGPAWGLSIVLLVIVVRLLLFPLFVKQIKSQRRTQELAPLVKELQKRHKGDRETMNAELMKLYKDNNANPISGCLPLLLQMPVFFALFSVMNEFRPGKDARFGLTAEQLAEGGQAKVFGAPIGAAFNSSADLVAQLDGNLTVVRSVALTMVVLMGLSTFWTQKQMMARAGTVTDPQQQQIQKFMLYVLPFSFAISGFIFPVGVLLYMVTTNLWSMGQQRWVISRMPPMGSGPAGGTTGKDGKGKPGGGPSGNGNGGNGGSGGKGKADGGASGGTGTDPNPRDPADPSDPDAPGSPATRSVGAPVLTASRPQAGGPSARKQAGSRKNKSKKRGRR